MYSVELYSRVRRACHVGGMSERAAAGHFGIDRKTVLKILKHAVPPGYRRNGPPARPKLDPFIPLINQILEEDKSRLKKQQRHTSKGRVASITGQARSTLTRENGQPTDSNLAQPSSVILLRARTPICASVF